MEVVREIVGETAINFGSGESSAGIGRLVIDFCTDSKMGQYFARDRPSELVVILVVCAAVDLISAASEC